MMYARTQTYYHRYYTPCTYVRTCTVYSMCTYVRAWRARTRTCSREKWSQKKNCTPVNYARWSSHRLKVLDGRGKLVVESNSTILKSHLNRDVQVCIINIWAWTMQYTYCTKFGVANQVTFKDCGIWLHHKFIFPIEYFQVMAGPRCIFDLWPPYAHHGWA